MDEMIEVLSAILEELQDINNKLDDIHGTGLYGVDDVFDKLDDIATALEK